MAFSSPRETVRALLAEAVAGLAIEWGFAAPAIADAIIERLARLPAGRGALVAEATVAGPGFINLRLSPSFWQGTLATILAAGDDWGRGASRGTLRPARCTVATPLRRHVRRLAESARCTRRATWRARWRRWRPRASSIATTTPSGSGRTALWNDDKDRVVMKSDGLPTYLLWVDAVAQVTCNALRLLGVSAPEQMTRLEENITKEDD